LKKTRFRHFFYHFFTPLHPFLGNQRPQQRNPLQRRWKTRRGKRGGQPRRGWLNLPPGWAISASEWRILGPNALQWWALEEVHFSV